MSVADGVVSSLAEGATAAAVLTSPDAAAASSLTLEFALASLSVPVFPASSFHPWTCLALTLVGWVVLALSINRVYATAANVLWFVWRRVLRRGGGSSSTAKGGRSDLMLSGNSEQPWGTRMLLAYATLVPSKQAYWRRLQRSCMYYFVAVVAGFYFLLTHVPNWPVDLFFTYTPGMELAFAAAATHFLVCCVEDWPCRAHMGRTKEEQIIVFYGYVFHHLLTSGAYLSVMFSHQLASMCLLGLTFEGPVLLGCFREFVALYDEDFDLFSKVPRPLLALNWALIFLSLLPCRLFAVVLFVYSASNWGHYLALVSPGMRIAYYAFGTLFSLINVGFTWLLSFWYRQDKRYLRKKAEKQRQKALEREREEEQRLIQAGGDNNGATGSTYSYVEEPQVSPVQLHQQQLQQQKQQHQQQQQQLHDAAHLAPMTRPLSPLLYAHPSPPSSTDVAASSVSSSSSPPRAMGPSAYFAQQHHQHQPQVLVPSTALPSAHRQSPPQYVQGQQQKQQWSNGHSGGQSSSGQ
jgi:hypothetical protein